MSPWPSASCAAPRLTSSLRSLGRFSYALPSTVTASAGRSRSMYMTPRRYRLSSLVESLATAFWSSANESTSAGADGVTAAVVAAPGLAGAAAATPRQVASRTGTSNRCFTGFSLACAGAGAGASAANENSMTVGDRPKAGTAGIARNCKDLRGRRRSRRVPEPASHLEGGGPGDRLIDVGPQVLDVLDPGRDPHQALGDAGPGPALGAELNVGRGGRQAREGLDAPEARRVADELEGVHHRLGGRSTALDLEREQRAIAARHRPRPHP